MNLLPLSPKLYKGVMLSSTFLDLLNHRRELISILRMHGFHDVAMENSFAKSEDVIASSLAMVQDSYAYAAIIGHRYGQTPVCSQRNPNNLSITELEFDEAMRLGRPILLFVMGENHPIVLADIETDSEKSTKLLNFRERAKQMGNGNKVERVYALFNSVDDFVRKGSAAISGLHQYFSSISNSNSDVVGAKLEKLSSVDPIPHPPALYAEPPYIGSHKFVGRQAQLDTLCDWVSDSDNHPVLLFEAIGGTGKSMLTWEWMTEYAPRVRDNWAGRFWYSFYEKGATMLDFCRRALAYMTARPRNEFREKNTVEMTELLMHQLQSRPWLLVLDGLERVLVSYHRFDAAQQLDELAGSTDEIASRDPCSAINSEDDDLLRLIAGARPSKLLLTSRLVPKALLNKSHQPIPGVLREILPGLRPTDAELLIRSCGVNGNSQELQTYLKKNCDCHPLVVGVLAGLINDYLPDRGNFDTWVAASTGGGQLNFAELDLVQKRNHILKAALNALSDASRQLLATISLLTESVDYPTLCEINPALSAIPESVSVPIIPEHRPKWKGMTVEERTYIDSQYRIELCRRKEYELAVANRKTEMAAATNELANTVRDLEKRGLLQYDHSTRRHDLHPVVRGIASSGLKIDEKSRFSQRLVDYFSTKSQDPFEKAESLDAFDNARRIINAFFQMEKLPEARDFVLKSTLLESLSQRFEAHNEILTIIRPFFTKGWGDMPQYLVDKGGVPLTKRASTALRRIESYVEAFEVAETGLKFILKTNRQAGLCSQILNLASTLGSQNLLYDEDRVLNLAGKVAEAGPYYNDMISYLLARYRQYSLSGRWAEADAIWAKFNLFPSRSKPNYIAAHHRAVHLYLRGMLSEEVLSEAEHLNIFANSALGIRNLTALRGYWYNDIEDFCHAKENLEMASKLARQAGKVDRRVEVELAIARIRTLDLPDPISVAESFDHHVDGPSALALARLYSQLGIKDKCLKFARVAYKWAYADGQPYTRSAELVKVTDLFLNLGVEVPKIETRQRIIYAWEEEILKTIPRLIRRR